MPSRRAFDAREIDLCDCGGRHAERRVHLQRVDAFGNPGRAYDVDPKAPRGTHPASNTNRHKPPCHGPQRHPRSLVGIGGSAMTSRGKLWWRSDSLTGNCGCTGSTGTTCLLQGRKGIGVVRSGHPLVHSTSRLSTIAPRNTTITKCALDQGYFLS